MSQQSLKALLPPTIQTARLTLHLFDNSEAHYAALLSAMNSPSAHARMGDFGIRTPAQLDELNFGTRLGAATLGLADVDVDCDVYYLPRVTSERVEGMFVRQIYRCVFIPRAQNRRDYLESTRKLYETNGTKNKAPLIGGVSLAQRAPTLPPDAGWCIQEAYHGRGYAAEAARALLDVARDTLHIREIMTWPGEENVPSIRTAEKAGFVRGGVVSGDDGEKHLVYVLRGMDFEKMKGATIRLFGEGTGV